MLSCSPHALRLNLPSLLQCISLFVASRRQEMSAFRVTADVPRKAKIRRS